MPTYPIRYREVWIHPINHATIQTEVYESDNGHVVVNVPFLTQEHSFAGRTVDDAYRLLAATFTQF